MTTTAKLFTKKTQSVLDLPPLFRGITLVLIVILTSAMFVLPAHAQTKEAANIQTVLSLYNGSFNTGDFAAFNQATAPDFVRHGPEGNSSREAYAATTIAFRTSFKGIALTPLVVFADGDWVAVNSTYSAVFTQDFPVANGKPISATQKPIAFNVIVFYHFNDKGLLAEMWEEYDSLNVYRQLGAMPMPTGAALPSVAMATGPLDPRSMVESGTVAMREIVRKKLVLTVTEAFGQGIFDPKGLIASPDFIAHPSEQNKDQFLQAILNLREAIPDLKVTLGPVIVEGNWAAAQITTSGTFTKALKGLDGSVIPPTNKPVTMTQNVIIRLDKNGNDAEQWAAQDNLSLLMQLGVMPASTVPLAN